MYIEQSHYINKSWSTISSDSAFKKDKAQLVFVFFGVGLVGESSLFSYIQHTYPNAQIIFISTAGEITDTSVSDDSISLAALMFEKGTIIAKEIPVYASDKASDIGERFGKGVKTDGLKHLLLFGGGTSINGSTLIQGVRKGFGENISISGGLAGDGGKFIKTYVSLNSLPDDMNRAIIVGLYGEVSVGLGSIGGWDDFGVDRIVTKSIGNTVYELDHKPILDLYKLYLGDAAKDLPSSGLLFPLSLMGEEGKGLVRTLLSVDETAKSITYAGDVPEGAKVRLMKANFERIIDAAGSAGKSALESVKDPDFALLISCIGRKLILKQRIEEELESIRTIIGNSCKISGFYSYGEIGRSRDSITDCQLHNQTMTVTLFSEK